MHTTRRLLPAHLTPALRALRLALPALALVAGAAALLTTAPQVRAADPIPAGSLTPVTLGELIFNDKSLSASGALSCASCHDKTRGHADPAGTFMPLGGPALDKQGHRSSMSLAYQALNPPFTLNGGPRGGYFWDGRSNTLELQAAGPLLNPIEMANASPAEVAAKLQAAPYWNELVRLYFTGSRATSARFSPLAAAANALAAYQRGDADYALFNSKFDRVQDGTATFTAAEARGLNIFNNPQRGNCASCHTSAPGPGGQRPLFTNQTYHALGLPRNVSIQANADANFYDLGLCGPDRSDLAARADLCGLFRVPTLRNVAVTGPYFHNGAVATLTDAVTFYATRDIDPRRWYPLVNGVPDKFNDMPVAYRGNVVQTPPFGQPAGAPPRLNAQDVADLVAFLNTLTDDTGAPRGGPVVQARAGR
jgi:cytochrome c peroxidase